MHTLGTHFEELLSDLRPPQDRLDLARDVPPLVRDYLKTNKDFVTIDPHTRLVGSYAQDLVVGDVKDVDFLVRVPGDPTNNEPEAKDLIQNLRGTLDGLPEALGFEGYAGLDLQQARRSVHVYFKGHDFHLDVVPCIAPGGFDEALWVPDRGFNQWIQSHPLGYVALLDDLNTQYGGKVKRLARLLKHFRNFQMKNRRPKSYWLGSLVIHHVRRDEGLDMSQPLAVIFRDLLDAIYRQYDHLLESNDTATPHIPDPLLGHDISWNWERTHFETFMRRLDEGRQLADRALACERKEDAISLWQQVFGEEYFPIDVSDTARSLADQGWPGHAFVGTTGLVSNARPLSGGSTATRTTTFHGNT